MGFHCCNVLLVEVCECKHAACLRLARALNNSASLDHTIKSIAAILIDGREDWKVRTAQFGARLGLWRLDLHPRWPRDSHGLVGGRLGEILRHALRCQQRAVCIQYAIGRYAAVTVLGCLLLLVWVCCFRYGAGCVVILRELWKGRSANDAGKTGGVSGSNRTITVARTHVAMGTRGLYTDHGEIRSMKIRVRGGSCGGAPEFQGLQRWMTRSSAPG